MDSIRIIWQGEAPPDRKGAEAQIRRELEDLMDDTEIKNLFFHTVFLGKTMDDESVFVCPTEGEDMSVDCWYSEKTTWTSITESDDTMQIVDQARDAMHDGPLPGSQPLVDPDYDT